MLSNSKIKFITLLLGVLIGANLYSQTLVYGIPLEEIKEFSLANKKEILNINKKLVDPKAVVEVEDCFQLYYGSAYLDSYSPYGERLTADVAYELLREKKYKDAINVSKNQILSNPGFVRPLYVMGIAYDKLGDSINSEIFFDRFYCMLSIPFFSGTGESADSAFVVRSIDDEYLIIGEMGYKSEGQALIDVNGVPYDILSVVSADGNENRDFYFNITQPFLLGFNFLDEKEDKKGAKKKKK